MGDASRWVIPDWAAYQVTETPPAGITIPPEGVFLLPICTTKYRFERMMTALNAWWPGNKYDHDHMIDVLEAMSFINDLSNPCVAPLLEELLCNQLGLGTEVREDGLAFRVTCGGTPIGDWIEFPYLLEESGFIKQITATGEKTIIMDTYNNGLIEAFPDSPIEDGIAANVCSGVKALADRLFDEVQFTLDQASLVMQQYKTASEGLVALSGSVLWGPFGSAMDWLDDWEEFVTSVAALGIATLKLAYSDPEVKGAFQQNLYCQIMRHPEKTFTKPMYTFAAHNLPLLESQSSYLAKLFRGFGSLPTDDLFRRVEKAYNLGSLNEDNTCEAAFDCTLRPWCYEWDLTQSSGGWVAFGQDDVEDCEGQGVWVSGQGWKSENMPPRHRLRLYRPYHSNTTITKVTIEYSPSPYNTNLMRVFCTDRDDMCSSAPNDLGEEETFLSHESGSYASPIEAHGAYYGIWDKKIALAIDGVEDGDGITITKIKVEGFGEMPADFTGGAICGEEPEEWCFEFDFEIDDYDEWISIVNSDWGLFGEYQSGVGYVAVNRQVFNGPNWNKLVYLNINVPLGATITSVEMIADRTLGTAALERNFRVSYGGQIANNPGAAGEDVSVKLSHEATPVSVACWNRVSNASSSGGLSGAGITKKIIITGIGPNPFGTSNC